MSGHSKWSKVKHQKATTDVVKAAAFTKASHGIIIAVREGGGIGDPNLNFHLRLAMEKAREVNMPKENIERAITKGKGTDAGSLVQVTYEGFAPGGVALIIEAATDNKQRTVSAVKNLLEHGGGTMVSPGAVSYMFTRRGVLVIPKGTRTIDEMTNLALEAGVDDVIELSDAFEFYVPVEALSRAKSYLETHQIPLEATEIIMFPKTTVIVASEHLQKINQLIEELEDADDIQHVFSNAQEA